MTIDIPDYLHATCATERARRDWLAALPAAVAALADRWALTLGAPIVNAEVSCAWVAPARCQDGTLAVLKCGMPHMESAHEIDGLQFWGGQPTVRLLAYDRAANAMLLERCRPGTHLRERSELEQDSVIASLLRRLWRAPRRGHPFRPLQATAAHWAEDTLSEEDRWPDAALVRDGLAMFAELAQPGPSDVLLATDLHAGNVLAAAREPWLVIDPKPFVGDPTYDVTQHLLNGCERLRAAPLATVRSMAAMLDLDHHRLRQWLFARLATQPSSDWPRQLVLAKALAP
jgi:streptomycin 6-kinase